MLARAQISSDEAQSLDDAAESERNDWLLWQLADSAFPTGGFAHSGGLEAAWQHGELRNRADLKTFIEASLRQFGQGSLPFMLAACDAPEEFSMLDQLCDCFLSNHVANRASRLQGQALLASAERIFSAPALNHLRQSTIQQPSPCHLSPVFGIVVGSLDIERIHASRLFIFLHLRGLTASAVRLGIVGPMEAQSLQHQCGPFAEAVRIRSQHLTAQDIAQTAPLLEIWQGAQDRLYSRLFQS
jgi:urease accessory protein